MQHAAQTLTPRIKIRVLRERAKKEVSTMQADTYLEFEQASDADLMRACSGANVAVVDLRQEPHMRVALEEGLKRMDYAWILSNALSGEYKLMKA